MSNDPNQYPLPSFVPRIIMVPINSQGTQTSHTTSTSLTVQTDSLTQFNQQTQTRTYQNTTSTQTFPTQSTTATQTPTINHTQSTPNNEHLGTLDESSQSIRPDSTRKRKSHHKDRSYNKHRKRVSFLQDIQNNTQISPTVSTTESSCIDLTVGQELTSDIILHDHLQPTQSFSENSNTSSTLAPPLPASNLPQQLAQPMPNSLGFQPITADQRAALVNAPLLSFFGNEETVSNILHTFQITQQQPPQQTQQQNNFTEEILNINDTHLISDEQ